MARILSQQALQQVLDNPKLYVDICNSLDVKPVSLPKLVQRNSDRLNSHDIVLMIAGAMGVEPNDILVEESEPQKTTA